MPHRRHCCIQDEKKPGAKRAKKGGSDGAGRMQRRMDRKQKKVGGTAKLSKWLARKFKLLDRIVDEQRYESIPIAPTSNGSSSSGTAREPADDAEGVDGVGGQALEEDPSAGGSARDGVERQVESRPSSGARNGKGTKRGAPPATVIASTPSSSSSALPPGVNHLSIATRPSIYPRRHFCSVCGCLGALACPRCGSRYCSSACCETHKESMCLKFGYN